jgi:hypothetical protein
MYARRFVRSRFSVTPSILIVFLSSISFTSSAWGQADQMPAVMGSINAHPGDSVRGASASNVYVSVREPNGLPVTESATVTLSCPLAGVKLSGPTKDTALAQFDNIPVGDCIVEVSAPGYKPAQERATVAASLGAQNQYVYVYLHSASEAGTPGRTAVPLNVLKEMDKGNEALRKNHFDEARKHYLKAEDNAPQNPDVQYLLGVLESTQNNVNAAYERYGRAISLSPMHEHALESLGELQLRKQSRQRGIGDAGKSGAGEHDVIPGPILSGRSIPGAKRLREG